MKSFLKNKKRKKKEREEKETTIFFFHSTDSRTFIGREINDLVIFWDYKCKKFDLIEFNWK